jgi:hypothetical protein
MAVAKERPTLKAAERVANNMLLFLEGKSRDKSETLALATALTQFVNPITARKVMAAITLGQNPNKNVATADTDRPNASTGLRPYLSLKYPNWVIVKN